MQSTDIKEMILDRVRNFYFSSDDFNGILASVLLEELEIKKDEFFEFCIQLISDQKIEISNGNNPHIKTFSGISVEHQISQIKKLELSMFCLYPSRRLIESMPHIDFFSNEPYTEKLFYGYGQLDFRVFDVSVLEQYKNDPRYIYETNHIGGYISISNDFFESDSLPDHDKIFLQTFGYAFNENHERVVAVFLRYLSDLSPEHQVIWKSKELKGDYKLHPLYYEHSILGNWKDGVSIFEALLIEQKIINNMTVLAFRRKLFRNEYDIYQVPEFGFLVRPTLAEFNAFVLQLDKILSENINHDFFKRDIPIEKEEIRDDGKVIIKKMGTIQLFEAWIKKHFRPENYQHIKHIFLTFKNVRKLRQKPAHVTEKNIFDHKYFSEQRELISNAFEAILTIRLIFENHPIIQRNYAMFEDEIEYGDIYDR